MSGRQGELFAAAAGEGVPAAAVLPLQPHQLLAWQQRLASFQAPLFREAAGTGGLAAEGQASLFAAGPTPAATGFDPLALVPQPLSFWRWPEAPQQGAAIYTVIDGAEHLEGPLLLYVGETGRADRRWKGEHDCKTYLAAYGDALRLCGLSARLSIRFWCDVPTAVRARRALEQGLIRRWQPPFNKETRGRWATPFTADDPG